jgi:hypothetical protein
MKTLAVAEAGNKESEHDSILTETWAFYKNFHPTPKEYSKPRLPILGLRLSQKD